MIFKNLITLIEFCNYNYYHIFLSIKEKNEILTDYIINFLKEEKKNIIIPKINYENNTLNNFIYNENTILETSKYGILEPINGNLVDEKLIDVVIIPLLSFDKYGYRVGYGKGFYDKFLLKCRKDIIKIGLSFFEAEEKIDDSNDFDIKLSYCVTPKNIYKF